MQELTYLSPEGNIRMFPNQTQTDPQIPLREFTFRNENTGLGVLMIQCTSIEIDGKPTNLLDLSQMYDDLKKEHEILKELVMQLYYAPPNGPGYLEAKLEFEENAKTL